MSDREGRLLPLRARARPLGLVGVLLVAIALLPFWLDAFWLQTGILAMSAAIAAIGLTLLVGVAGQLSLGHAFFVAVGAYGYGYLASEGGALYGVGGGEGLGWPPLAALVVAVAASGVAGALFSPISGRLRGIYLGIATLGLVFLGQHLLTNVPAVEAVSGGFNGRDIKPFEVPGFRFTSLERIWYLGLVLVILSYWCARNLKRGRTGRALEAVRDSEIAAGVMGVDVRRTRAAAFTISSMYAGLGGALYAASLPHIVPQRFDFIFSIELLAMVVIGGLGSIGGAVLGASFVTILPLVLSQYSGVVPLVGPAEGQGLNAAIAANFIFGAAIVATLMFLPSGLAGLGRVLRPTRPPRPPPRRASAPHSP